MNLKFWDNSNRLSLAGSCRAKRFLFFQKLLSTLQRPLQILDIGGTQQYWDMMAFQDAAVTVTLLNLTEQTVTRPNFVSVSGDATKLTGYPDHSVEVVYSNSVIEHLHTKEAQQKMADEVRRVSQNYFVQTPNYYFFIEPHWVFPMFQFLPFRVRVWLTRNLNLGHVGRIRDEAKAVNQVREIRLLTENEMRQLFPDATVYREKVFCFTKSIVAYKFAATALV